jgi:hypothetical protein
MADWLALVDAHGGEYYLNLDLLPGARFQQGRAMLLGLTDPEGRAIEVTDPAALAALRGAFGRRAASSVRDQRARAETDASAEGPPPIVMADHVSITSRGGDSRIIPRAEWEAMTPEQRAAWQAGRQANNSGE